MKNLKYILGVVSILLLLVTSYFYFWLNPASANPDYICVKSIKNPSCDIQKCDERNTDTHERICYWRKVTSVWYYHTRTSCQDWYSKAKSWSTAWSSTAAKYAKYSKLDSDWRKAHYEHPSSGRHSKDFAWSSVVCQILEVDNDKPMWEVLQVLDNWETTVINTDESKDSNDN